MIIFLSFNDVIFKPKFQRKLPKDGWIEADILELLSRLSRMDSNNLTVKCGVGEREGRIFSGILIIVNDILAVFTTESSLQIWCLGATLAFLTASAAPETCASRSPKLLDLQ